MVKICCTFCRFGVIVFDNDLKRYVCDKCGTMVKLNIQLEKIEEKNGNEILGDQGVKPE